MTQRYRLSTYAERDLSDIFNYTLAVWGPDQLTRYQILIEDALDRLSHDPDELR